MKRFLTFLFSLLAITGWSANPPFEAFRGTNEVVISSNVSAGRIIIGPATPISTTASNAAKSLMVWTNEDGFVRLNDTFAALRYIGFTDTNAFLTRHNGGASIDEERNLGLGYMVGNVFTDGSRNSLFGNNCGRFLTIGSLNSGFGFNSLATATEAANNAGFGARTLQFLTTGSQNTAVGLEAMQSVTTGTDNCAIGYDALDVGNYSFNCAFGSEALHRLQTGNRHAAFGYRAGFNSRSTGGFNTFLGALSDHQVFPGTDTNSFAVGYNAKISANNQGVLGNELVTVVKTAAEIQAALGMKTNAAVFEFITTNLLSGQVYTNFAQRGEVVATVVLTNVLAGDFAAMSLIVDQNGDGTWDSTNGPVSIQGVALSAAQHQLTGLLQPNARFAFTNQSAGVTPGSAVIWPGSCQWSRE